MSKKNPCLGTKVSQPHGVNWKRSNYPRYTYQGNTVVFYIYFFLFKLKIIYACGSTCFFCVFTIIMLWYYLKLWKIVVIPQQKEDKLPSSTTIPKNAYCGSLCFYNKMIVAELRFIVVVQYTHTNTNTNTIRLFIIHRFPYNYWLRLSKANFKFKDFS